jgi:hypothetical protein
VKTASTHKAQEDISKFTLCMNMSFTGSDQFTAHRELSLFEGTNPWRGHQEIQSQENYEVWTVDENSVGS